MELKACRTEIRRPNAICEYASRRAERPRWARAYSFALVSVLALLVSSPAYADEPEPGSREALSGVTPPRVIQADVAFPEGAEGEASVTLRLLIGPEGHVEEAEVFVGDEPFASAALAAALNWRFEPARRGGEGIAVRIMMEAHFVPPEVRAPHDGPSRSEPTPQERAASAGEPSPQTSELLAAPEVVVHDDSPPSSRSLSRAEARQIPGALFGDPLRALDALPGVTTMVSGLPVYYVRGAPPGDVRFYVDDIQVPVLYHVLLGPSVISPELIEGVHLHSAAYPGRYGRAAGGVVEAELRRPTYRPSFGAGLGLWDASAFVETPFAGERGNLFLAGRYSLTGLLISQLGSQVLDYWDYQGLVDYDLGASDQLRVFSFGGHDYLKTPDADFLGADFHRADLRYTHRLGFDTQVQVGLTLGHDRTSFVDVDVVDRSLAARVMVEHSLSPKSELRAGITGRVDGYELELGPDSAAFAAIRQLFPARQDEVFGAFVELPSQLTNRIFLVPGVRADVYRSRGRTEVGVDPRLSARFRLHPNVDAVHAVSYAHQPPNFVPNIVPGLSVAGLDGGLQRTFQSSAGVELKLPADVRGGVTAFQNTYFGLTDPYSLSQRFVLDDDFGRQRMLGHAYGLEVELRRPLTRRLGALLSYTLSRSTRAFEATETLAGSDRTHVLNAAAMYTLGDNWRLGARSVAYSGVAGKLRGQPRFPYERSAPYARLDLRLERRFRLGPESHWSFVVEALNVTQSREVAHRVCAPAATGLSCKEDRLPAVPLPNLKIEARL